MDIGNEFKEGGNFVIVFGLFMVMWTLLEFLGFLWIDYVVYRVVLISNLGVGSGRRFFFCD